MVAILVNFIVYNVSVTYLLLGHLLALAVHGSSGGVVLLRRLLLVFFAERERAEGPALLHLLLLRLLGALLLGAARLLGDGRLVAGGHHISGALFAGGCHSGIVGLLLDGWRAVHDDLSGGGGDDNIGARISGLSAVDDHIFGGSDGGRCGGGSGGSLGDLFLLGGNVFLVFRLVLLNLFLVLWMG